MTSEISFILFPAMAMMTVVALIAAGIRLALRVGYVDRPGGRKTHDSPTPPIGGIIIVPVFIILSGLAAAMGVLRAQDQMPFWCALGVMMVAGALDDRYEIRPRWKFLAQFIAAIMIVVWGGARVTTLGNLFGFGDVWLGAIHIPFSIIACVLLINAMNLMDGLDGLAGGKTLVALGWMVALCFYAGADAAALSGLILIGCIAGFLIYNMRSPLRKKASVFLGDAGSMSLGLSLAWFGMTLGRGEDPVIWPIVVAWILALPIMDTCAQFARRVARGRHPFDADRNHFHHHFVNVGVPVGVTTAIIMSIGFFTGLIGVTGMIMAIPEPVLAWVWIIVILAHIAASLRPARLRRLLAALFQRDEKTPS